MGHAAFIERWRRSLVQECKTAGNATKARASTPSRNVPLAAGGVFRSPLGRPVVHFYDLWCQRCGTSAFVERGKYGMMGEKV